MKFPSLIPLFLAAGLFAQGAPTPFGVPTDNPVSGGGGGNSSSGNGAGGTAGDYSSGTAERMSDRLFDVNSDSVDLENGSMQWKGKTFNLGDTRIMRARFDRYLSTPAPAQDFESYLKILAEIEKRISAMNLAGSEAVRIKNLQEAWNLLFDAAKSDYDGGASVTLANQVMKSWRQRGELRSLNISIEQQKYLTKKQEDIINNRADRLASRQNEAAAAAKGKKGAAPASPNSSEGVRELAGLEAEHKAGRLDTVKQSAESDLISVRSKLEFQSTIVAYLVQRRFTHTLLASGFYRQIYKATHQTVDVGKEEIAKLFPVSNFVPSLEALDSVAREAQADIRLGLGAFRQLDSTGDKFAAYERLQETYFLGEYDAEVIRLPLPQKRAYTELARDIRDLQKQGDERDLAGAEETLARVSAVAKDFPSARVRSKIQNAKQASNMAVGSAKMFALANGKDAAAKVADQLAVAAKYWPLNPAINAFAGELGGQASLVTKAVPEFDRLETAGKFRDIFERKNEFALAFLQDQLRMERLNKIISRVGEVELLVGQAIALSERGNNYQAWDALAKAYATSPDDSKVATLRAKLAPSVADYAKRLDDAARAEGEGRLGSALTAYLAAQDLNPFSPVCGGEIERVAGLLIASVPSGK